MLPPLSTQGQEREMLWLLQPELLSCYVPIFSSLSLAQESRRCVIRAAEWKYVGKEEKTILAHQMSWLCDICAKFAKSTRLYHSRTSCRLLFLSFPHGLGTLFGTCGLLPFWCWSMYLHISLSLSLG
ncbi:hypothetical protein F4820DRAFT_408404 [Hypoxylon rubiginosum]|uniref:Uncharacterized protein n=1 Tax=Hypoxylon rubiginosum TaxID=110542 RepID=A0ACB9ZCT2_9PEZI|nr:hypothetical protein F4820DRAFT_408404 [Hypoxylon rubiginosum]